MKMNIALKSLMALTLLATPAAQAHTIAGPELRQELIKMFAAKATQFIIEQSKQPKSELGKILAPRDQDDGRNNSGNINIPLSAADIQLTVLGGENEFGSDCFAESQAADAKVNCTSDSYVRFLVTIASMMGVHRAADFDSVSVYVDVNQDNKWAEDMNGNNTTPVETTYTVKLVPTAVKLQTSQYQ